MKLSNEPAWAGKFLVGPIVIGQGGIALNGRRVDSDYPTISTRKKCFTMS